MILGGKWIAQLFICCLVSSAAVSQESNQKFTEFKSLTKRVYHYTKVEFITPEGEFNDAICTLVIPENVCGTVLKMVL